MPPSLTKCWATWARSCVDLVWIVLSCQATQAERPDSLTQSKPNLHTVLLHSAQHFWVTEAWITLTFNCPIQISNFFHKTSTVRCPLPAHLIKSMDIEKKFSVDKNVIWAFEGTDYILSFDNSPLTPTRTLSLLLLAFYSNVKITTEYLFNV